jgi:hypothetical protein
LYGLGVRERARRRGDAEHAAFVRVLHDRIVDANGGYLNGATAELGVLLAVSTRSAQHLVGTAYELTARPVVWQGLFDGLIDAGKARKIVTLLDEVPDPEREALERLAIGYATDHSAAQLHRRLLRWTCDEDPEETLRRQAVDRRHVAVIPAGHGMAWVSAYLSAEHAHTVMAGIDALVADPGCPDPYGQGEDRSADQRRADALIGFLDRHTDWSTDVLVVIPADMLMGVETSGATLNGSACTRSLALHLAWSPDARWTRLVTDPLTGILTDVGRTTYAFPKAMRDAIRLRDVTCRFPGCALPAEFTDTDHIIPYTTSRRTRPDDAACECRSHHRIKTFECWTLSTTGHYGDTMTWRGPFGTTATTTAHDYRPSTTKHPRPGHRHLE